MMDFIKKLDELSGGLVSSVWKPKSFPARKGRRAYFHLVGNDKLKARRLMLVGVGEADDYKEGQSFADGWDSGSFAA